jgi:hypothetical protein
MIPRAPGATLGDCVNVMSGFVRVVFRLAD